MKKEKTASNRDGGGAIVGANHRTTASSSVGTSLKQRSSAAAAPADTSTNTTERTGYHQSGATGGGQISKPNAFKQSQNASGTLSAAAAAGQERKCDSCKYRTPIN